MLTLQLIPSHAFIHVMNAKFTSIYRYLSSLTSRVISNIQGLQYQKLTELILKNNIQCKLYSKANFQFEFLARIGFCCPKLRVFDVFGTDTWADCLIALFFKDAFHSLHRLVVNSYKQ
jgi:hypothetical protein